MRNLRKSTHSTARVCLVSTSLTNVLCVSFCPHEIQEYRTRYRHQDKLLYYVTVHLHLCISAIFIFAHCSLPCHKIVSVQSTKTTKKRKTTTSVRLESYRNGTVKSMLMPPFLNQHVRLHCHHHHWTVGALLEQWSLLPPPG